MKGEKGKKAEWQAYTMLRLEKEAAVVFNAAAATLGISRVDLLRMLAMTYVALIKEQGMHPAAALQRVLALRGESGKASAELRGRAGDEQGTVG